MADTNGYGAAAVGAGATALANYAVQAASNRRQFKYQKEAMALQQQYNKDLWDYQNAYNTPQAQMERLKAAGLNPYLIYGSGSASAGNAAPIDSTEVPSRQATRAEIPDLQLRRLSIRQADAQYAATMQAIESNKQKTALVAVQTSLRNLELMRESMRSKNYAALQQAEKRTAQFVAAQSEQVFYNQQAQEHLLKQMHDQREGRYEREIKTADLEIAFKQNRNELAKYGIYQSDHPLFRVLLQASQRMNIPLDELLARGYNQLRYLMP